VAGKDETARVASAERKVGDVMNPEGLFGRSVRIVYPVRGEVVQRFGKTKVTDFADMIFSKGFEYKTAEGSQVRAVLGGRVAFAGEMPGYDTVVIIDHGARSYSLYGRLGKSFVSKGDLIGQKEPVGVTSVPDERGRNFYFETRKNGTPVDPSGVLARAS
jgi:septal ring factor EnvC (AmiA/AmiB activator)